MHVHLAADPELYLESVHTNEIPGVEEGLVFVGRGHEPVVGVLGFRDTYAKQPSEIETSKAPREIGESKAEK